MNNKITKRNKWLIGLSLVIGHLTFSAALTSCSDYLDLMPMNEVVLENYWTQKSDVESVLGSCYESLSSGDCVTRMGLWGEVRSENLKLRGNDVTLEVQHLVKENILPTNTYCNWTVFYQAINRCNTVCYYAPKVKDIDPNYGESQMKANIAEAVFIRSLCYFHLIRTFRDVPYSTEPSIDDSQEYRIPATKFDVVLDSLIASLEAVKDDAPLYYAKPDPEGLRYNSNEIYNTGRVTRAAIYSLLADLYLWKGDWQKVCDCADFVINFKKDHYDLLTKRHIEDDIYLYDNTFPLIRDKKDNNNGYAYNDIFGEGNSFESIFELTYDKNYDKSGSDEKYCNQYLKNFYHNLKDNRQGNLSLMTELYGELPDNDSKLYSKNDNRPYEFINKQGDSYSIRKYIARSSSFDRTKSNWQSSLSPNRRSDNYANWIVYRLTDVMLMKAEALVQMGDSEWDNAYNLVLAVSNRAAGVFSMNNTLIKKNTDYTTLDDREQLVLDERHRELIFEGKRWYDLLRQARRSGSSEKLADAVTEKQDANRGGIKIKMMDTNYLYLPYFRNELKVNPYLKQNPAYNFGGEDEFNKN